MELVHDVSNLIEKGHEGSYWDFKLYWHDNNADLLKDIICMANNTSPDMNDGYIIFGVADKTYEVVGISDCKNRKNQESIIGILSSKQWSSEEIPEITVSSVFIGGTELDVLTIYNKSCTPYYLLEDCTKIDNAGKKKVIVKAGVIYSRVGDRNTASSECATKSASEFLWKKRFGLVGTDEFKIMKRLCDVDSWYTLDESEILYNRVYSDIQIVRTGEGMTVEIDEGRAETTTWVMDFPYLFSDMLNWNIGKNETGERASWLISLEGRELEIKLWGVRGTRQEYFLIEPNKKWFRDTVSIHDKYNFYYCYFQDSIRYLAYQLFIKLQCPDIEERQPTKLFTIVPVFKSEQEHDEFIKYINKNINNFNTSVQIQPIDEMFPLYSQGVGSVIVYKTCKAMVQWLAQWRLQREKHYLNSERNPS